MSISLVKGQRIDLTKNNSGLKNLLIGLGWDPVEVKKGLFFKRKTAPDIDLDASVLMLKNDKLEDKEDLIYFGNLKSKCGGVIHTGDNLTGEGDGDDEQILVDLSLIPSRITKINFTVTIHEADERGQNFGQVSNAYVRVVNQENDEELLRYDLGEDFSVETAIVVAQLYKYNGEWKFNAIGSGFSGGLAALCKNFGLNV